MEKLAAWKVLVALAVLVIAIGFLLNLHDHQPDRQAKQFDKNARNSKFEYPTTLIPRARSAPAPPGVAGPSDGQLAELLVLRLPRETIEEYLRLHHRSAASLLAAFHASGNAENPGGDLKYLKEAATNFPNDPQVQLAVLAHDVFPEARRQWLDAFKASSPSNSLANYLSAREYFKNGHSDAAIKELLEATAKSQFADFAMENYLVEKEMYRASGKPLLESNQAAMSGASSELLPELAMLKGLAQSMRELQNQYVTGGDITSAENLAQVNLALANRLTGGDSGKLIISQLVGMAIEAVTLAELNPNTPYAFLDGQTPNQRKEVLKQQRASLRELSQSFQAIVPSLTDAELEEVCERERLFGEIAAMRWLVEQRRVSTPGQGR